MSQPTASTAGTPSGTSQPAASPTPSQQQQGVKRAADGSTTPTGQPQLKKPTNDGSSQPSGSPSPPSSQTSTTSQPAASATATTTADGTATGATTPNAKSTPSTPPGTAPQNLPRVQDALGYLEKVKNRFVAQPTVYNHFLDIMKDFKSQAIDTEGVIRRVKTLFKGHRSLILGFNQFLPPGYKIDLDATSSADPGSPMQRPNIEFNHAVQYVAKIKHRFRDTPEIYAEFLDILHDYQAKRTIEEVYKRVQKLFAGQHDLLYEFKYFLPDNAFANAQAAKKVPTPKPPRTSKNKSKTASSAVSAEPSPTAADAVTKKSRPPTKIAKATAAAASTSAARAARNIPQSTIQTVNGRLKKTVIYPAGSEKELALFDRLKQWCDKRQWMAILKALNLYAQDILTRPELVHSIAEILGDKPGADDFYQRFRTALQYEDGEEKLLVQGTGGYYAYITNVDLSTTPPVTTSYRALPSSVPIPSCSGRTALGDLTLNDQFISIPTGSEDFSFKSLRRNIYEENLFRCEDERYELDMIIENNNAVIQLLQPIADQLQNMSVEQQRIFDVEPLLDILHLRAIARIYAENAGDIIEMLKLHPVQTIPVILTRMKQKDTEWRLIQQEMRLPWRRIFEQNYVRSLDHRSFYFKQEDKKRRLPKVLVQELREVHHQYFVNSGLTEGEKIKSDQTLTDSVTPLLRQVREGSAPAPVFNYCMRFLFPESDMHHQVTKILMHVAKKTYTARDQYELLVFLTGFAYQFFGVQTTADQQRELSDFKQEAAKDVSESVAPQPVKQHIATSTAATAEALDDEIDEDGATATSSTLPVAAASSSKKSKAKKAKSKSKAATSTSAMATAASRNLQATRAKEHGPSITSRDAGDDDEDGAGVDDVEVDRQGGDKTSSDGEEEELSAEKARAGLASQQANATTATPAAAGACQQSRSGVLPGTLTQSQAPSIETIVQKIQQTLSGEWKKDTHIKPIRLSLASWELDEEHQPIRRHTRPSRLFFASNALYVFFRLHQFLYERLSAARQLAHKSRKQLSKKSKIPHTSEERWSRYLELVYELLDNTLENSKYEDECRNLLGASAYVLFNMDKLVAQLVKQSVSLIHNDTSSKLLALYQYEMQRIAGMAPVNPVDKEARLQRSAELARMYLTNAASILGDDHVCQIEYFDDSNELCIGLVDGLTQSAPQNVSEEWANWLESYLSSPATYDANNKSFLLRNVKAAMQASVKAFQQNKLKVDGEQPRLPAAKDITRALLQQDPDQAPLASVYDLATTNSVVLNGLASNIDVRNYKMYYVDETEDLFVRSTNTIKQYQAPAQQLNRTASQGYNKLTEWVTGRVGEIKTTSESASKATTDAAQQNEQMDDAAAALLNAAAGDDENVAMEDEDPNQTSSASSSPQYAPDDNDDNQDQDADDDDLMGVLANAGQ